MAERKYGPKGLQGWVLSHIPDFCFQTFQEFITLLEQIDEDVDEESVKHVIWLLVKKGELEKRRCSKIRANGYQLRRRSKPV